MTTVFAFKFSDHEHFTNRYMSLGIFNQINQIIFVLETKKISMHFSCLCIVILCKHKTGDCMHLFNAECLIHTKSTEILNASLKQFVACLLGLEVLILFIQKSIIKYLFDPADFL